MLKIALLLIGPQSFRPYWHAFLLFAVIAWMVAGLVVWDAVTGDGGPVPVVAGGMFLAAGLAAFLAGIGGRAGRAERHLSVIRVGLPFLAAGMMLSLLLPQGGWLLSLVLAVALIVDGGIRVMIALIVHIPRWRLSAVYGVLQLAGAACLLLRWPLSPTGNVILAVALGVGLFGWTLARIGWQLRGMAGDMPVVKLPIFAGRGWHDHAPTPVGDEARRQAGDAPLILHVWTPVKSADVKIWLPVIDRYFATADIHGSVSGGHVSLELGPDLYVSHYPGDDIERTSTDFIKTLSAEPSHHKSGRFVPSFVAEVDDWCPQTLEFHLYHFSEARLRAFWDNYRRDDTYNLVNRNCAIIVASGLEAALEGMVAGGNPWLRLLRLLSSPSLWLAALIRGRAEYMTWTPCFVFDYCRELTCIIEQCEAAKMRESSGFLAQLRARRIAAATQKG